MNDLMFKADDKAAWDAFVETFPEGATVLVDEIGPVVTTPAVYDGEGNLVTPAVMDEHHHVNVRVITPLEVCSTLAAGASGVVWIDPVTVSSPSRIWAGGMNYWVQSGGGV
jgi:hypothetical protein